MTRPAPGDRSGGADPADRERRRHQRVAVIALVAAVAILAVKVLAWLVTGSVGLASDAAESVANVVAGVTLLAAVRLARTPPDFDHPYGHEKIEDLSGTFEAGLIVLAAVLIAVAAIVRLADPPQLVRLGPGLLLAAGSAAANGGLAWWLFRQARRLDSAALRANARHVRTDVWTSLGVILGVAAVAVTGVQRLDPVVALVVAAQIGREGVRLAAGSISRLMDERLPPGEEEVVLEALERHDAILGWHRLRSRRSGRSRFVEVDVFVDGATRVDEAHAVVADVEDAIHAHLPNLVTTVHVEPYQKGLRDAAVRPEEEFDPDEPERTAPRPPRRSRP
ncbi:MAG: cation diffusion facilitator family transporter [Trueperaceae bacterium]